MGCRRWQQGTVHDFFSFIPSLWRGSLVLSLLPGKRHPAPCKQCGAALHLPECSNSGPELPVCWDEGFGETGLS